MWLPWDYALVLCLACFLTGRLARRSGRRWVVGSGAFASEAAVVALLYAAWQLAGRLSVMHTEGAADRARWIWDVERLAGLPDEAATQAMVLGHGWLVQASNIYYAGAHVPGMGIFLIWLFARHRDHYPGWRNAIAVLTAVSLAIQLLPVAPPRLVDELGVADTGIIYGQSVYATMGDTVAGQLQAMPSLHVGWAVLIGVAAMQVSDSPWRWTGMAHAALTSWVVVVTGNHFWLDGIVVVALLAVIMAAQRNWRRRTQRLEDRPDDDGNVIEPWSDRDAPRPVGALVVPPEPGALVSLRFSPAAQPEPNTTTTSAPAGVSSSWGATCSTSMSSSWATSRASASKPTA